MGNEPPKFQQATVGAVLLAQLNTFRRSGSNAEPRVSERKASSCSSLAWLSTTLRRLDRFSKGHGSIPSCSSTSSSKPAAAFVHDGSCPRMHFKVVAPPFEFLVEVSIFVGLGGAVFLMQRS